MKHNIFRLFIVSCAVMLGTGAFAGTFKDRTGTAHSWAVNDSHALVWDGAVYIPFGAAFEPKYLADGQTDANWTSDEAAVDALKNAGVKDIILKSGSKGLTAVPVEAFQRVIDMLDAKGLRYGIELADPPYEPLSGYVIAPTVNRVDDIDSSQEITRPFPDTKIALYALCDAKTGALKRFGQSIAVNGDVSVQAMLRVNDKHVLLLYPQKVIAPGNSDWSLPDLWSDFDKHRDHLIAFLSQIKFGGGLRFFADPFTDRIGLRGDTESLIPTSTAFRLEYSAWLSRKYGAPRDINVAWGVHEHEIISFAEAAQLIPLWKDGRGVPLAYDDVSGAKYAVDTTKSNLWSDFREFRAQSIRSYMDAIADAAKRLSADVPVVYTANGLQPIFQSVGLAGYDGLAVPASGEGDTLTKSAGQVLSLADNSSRKMWMISRLGGYSSKESMFGAMNGLRDLGAKGFFADVRQQASSGGSNPTAWLAEYASSVAGDKNFANYIPQTAFYPAGATRAKVKQFSGGTWWLPSLAKGEDLNLGSSLGGYTIVDANTGGTDICIWSLKGSQTLHFAASHTVTLVRNNGEKTDIKPSKKGGRVEVTVGEEPVVVRGLVGAEVLPLETVNDALQEMEKAVARADQQKMDTGSYKYDLQQMKGLVNINQFAVVLDMARVKTDEINQRMRGLNVEIKPDAGKPLGS